METAWYKEALFAGQTGNAFKLGTVLTLGWFWPRVSSCSVLYRGRSMWTIDFDTILAVANADSSQISPPNYVSHENNTTYYYVVRRVNSCGYQEYTLSAAVKVSIDADGDLAQPQPNGIFDIKAEQVEGDKVQLLWFYSPIDQESEPESFNIYYDKGTGQIDYQNPMTTIPYAGRIFYSYKTQALSADKYLFAVRAEDAMGTENISLARIRINIQTVNPDAIDILSTEVI